MGDSDQLSHGYQSSHGNGIDSAIVGAISDDHSSISQGYSYPAPSHGSDGGSAAIITAVADGGQHSSGSYGSQDSYSSHGGGLDVSSIVSAVGSGDQGKTTFFYRLSIQEKEYYFRFSIFLFHIYYDNHIS